MREIYDPVTKSLYAFGSSKPLAGGPRKLGKKPALSAPYGRAMTLGEIMDNGPAIREAARRARALVNKHIPEKPAHGWQDPEGFVDACRRRKARDYFYLGAYGAYLRELLK